MIFLEEYCTITLLDQNLLLTCKPFDCGDSDLNYFFREDAISYSRELLGKTYCYLLDRDPSVIVCAFTLSNDSIKVRYLPNSRKKKVNRYIPRMKQYKSYPAVLLGRLGVNKEYINKGIGRELLSFIKAWFIEPMNKTGCRFLVVDAYNQENTLRFYLNNGFEFIFSTEEQEKEFSGFTVSEILPTRSMYFDLRNMMV